MSWGAEVGHGVAFASDVVAIDVVHVVLLDASGEVRVNLDALQSMFVSESEPEEHEGRTWSTSCSSMAMRRDWNHSNESSASRGNNQRDPSD